MESHKYLILNITVWPEKLDVADKIKEMIESGEIQIRLVNKNGEDVEGLTFPRLRASVWPQSLGDEN